MERGTFLRYFFLKKPCGIKKLFIFAPANEKGAIAQLVEQRTENPCVPGSIPGGTTFLSNRNVAQLVAHYVRDVGVGRSSRLIPTEERQMILYHLPLFHTTPQ